MLRNEISKLRRTQIWVVIVVIPALSVLLGAFNYSQNVEVLTHGWGSYWSQLVLFYGLLLMSLGVAVLASSVWRAEHRNHGWNQLLTSQRRPGRVLLAKIAVLGLLAAAMQVVLVCLGLLVGAALRVPGSPPVVMLVATVLSVVPALAVAAWQSLLSMLVRNFAAPIGVALLGGVVSFGLVASQSPLAYLFPPALVSMTQSLGSTATTVAGSLTFATVAPLLLASALLTGLGWAAGVWWLSRADSRC